MKADRKEIVANFGGNERKDRLLFLDGVRGWAALAVVLYHLLPTFLLTAEQQQAVRWLMPPIDGALAVVVFFVVSGFSLSIAFVRKGSRLNIASLAIRRYPRLLIPVLAATLVAYAMMRTGLNSAPQLAAMTGHTNWPAKAYQFSPSFLDAIRFGTWDVFFDYDDSRAYSPVLWTMSVEMAGSALVLGALAALGKSPVRWIAYGALWAAFAYLGSPLTAFVAGIVLAEIYDRRVISRLRRSNASLFLSLLMIAGVWIVSVVERPLYANATAVSIFGTIVVAAVVISDVLNRAMSCRISRKLGHLSFPLYLTHSVVLCIVASRIGIQLLGANVSEYLTVAIEVLVVVPLCLIVASFFAPIESFAIDVSRKLSDLLQLSRRKA